LWRNQPQKIPVTDVVGAKQRNGANTRFGGNCVAVDNDVGGK